MTTQTKIFFAVLLAIVVLGSMAILKRGSDTGGAVEALQTSDISGTVTENSTSTDGDITLTSQITNNAETKHMENRIAVIETNKGVIKIELYEDAMPITTGNFIKLAESGYYDGTKFHRIIPNFMIQGGDPNSKGENTMLYGTGGPGYAIPDEFVKGDLLTNTRGSIAMANSGPNSGGSQFFINVVDNTFLDFDKPPLTSRHPVFGRVVEGMDVADAISVSERGARDIPTAPIVVNKITITK